MQFMDLAHRKFNEYSTFNWLENDFICHFIIAHPLFQLWRVIKTIGAKIFRSTHQWWRSFRDWIQRLCSVYQAFKWWPRSNAFILHQPSKIISKSFSHSLTHTRTHLLFLWFWFFGSNAIVHLRHHKTVPIILYSWFYLTGFMSVGVKWKYYWR